MIYQFEDLSLDTQLYQLKHRSDVVTVEPRVFDMLVYLVDRRDRVVTRKELLETLWPNRVVGDASLSACLKAARRAVGDSGQKQKIIETVHGRGYRFVAPVDSSNAMVAAIPNLVQQDEPGPSIAVLPFANASGDLDQQYFAQGIARSIAMELSRNRSLLVVLADWLEEGVASGQAFAAELNVRYLLKGGVQKMGERVRVSAELIDGETGAIRWSERFDREGVDVIDIQDEISQQIANALWGYRGQIQNADTERMSRKPTNSLSAYDYVLRGVANKELYTRDNNLAAIECFKKATALDPQYADAYAWLSWVYGMEVIMRWADDRQGCLDLALASARKAVELDRFSAIGHSAVGFLLAMSRRFDESMVAFDRCLEICPGNSDSLALKAEALVYSGRSPEAVATVREAMEVNRLHPEWYWWILGSASFLAGQYAAAVDALSHMTTQNNDSLMWLAASYAQQGDLDQARIQTSRLMEIEPDFTLDATRYPFKSLDDYKRLREGLVKAGAVVSEPD